MKFIECLASYVPGLIVDRLIKDCDEHQTPVVPWRQEYETVCVFCDVSGFTALSEAMALNGKGAEGLAKHLNSYFSQMVRIIAADGGDVFKFAGDAMIVLWPECPQPGDMETTVRRAAQCAVAIQENLDKSIMEEGVQLSVKIGIGFGRVSVLHVGGVYGRVEYLAVGEPLIQAFHAEHSAVSGQVICSKEVWKIISDYFPLAHLFSDGSVRIDLEAKDKIKLVRKSSKMNTLRNNMSDTDPILESRMKAYVAGAVLPNLNRDSPEDEQWGNELRRCTVMFVNLGMKEQHLLASAVYDEAMIQVHDVLMTVQKSVYQYEGSINKFLMDDKGSTLIACFGLPPVSHDDDPTRAVLASLLLCEGLYDLGLIASVGITTGDVFCGVVGSKTRREYTVLGDSVNLSARLMQRACADGGGVLCDWETKSSSNGMLNFATLDEIRVKGKTMSVKVFRPYPSITTAGSKGRNIYHDIHKQQLQNAIVHKSLLALQTIFTPDTQLETRIVSLNSQSSGVTNINSTPPSYSLNESITSSPSSRRQSSALMEHMKLGGPSTRTRKSAVRTSIASSGMRGSDHLLSAVDVVRQEHNNNLANNSNTMGRRMSSTSHKINASQRNFGKMSSFGGSFRTSLTLDTIEINVLVPNGFVMSFSCADTLRPIFPNEVKDFQHLRRKILELCESAQIAIPPEVSSNDIALNVSGTRFFLPDCPEDIRWLSAYYLEAKSGFHDNWKFGQPIELIVCLKSEVKKVQSRLAFAHCQLIYRKIQLIESRKGSTIILEGDPGIGKTHLISQFIKNTLPNTCPIYYSPASPYSLEPFGPFNILIQQFLDSKAFFGYNNCRTRTEVLKDILSRGGGRLLLDGYLLDKYLYTNITEELIRDSKNLQGDGSDSEDEENPSLDVADLDLELTSSQKSARRFALYYYLLFMIGCEENVILIIDDAQTIDDESWSLLLLLSLTMEGKTGEIERIFGSESHLPTITSGFISTPSILFIISLRPLIKHRSVFRGSSPIYESLANSASVTFMKLDGLPPEEMEEYLLSKLGGNVTYMSDQLMHLIDQKCMSNPWMMGQLIDTLQVSQPPVLSFQNIVPTTDDSLPTLDENQSFTKQSVSSTQLTKRKLSFILPSHHKGDTSLQEMQVDLVADFDSEKCPLPVAVAKIFGTLFDRLSSCQQMILKTAAYIGRQFSWSYLYHCYPLNGHKYRLRRELYGLIGLGYLVEIPNLKNQSSLNNQMNLYDPSYHFISDFLLSFISVRMLREQKDKIKMLIEKHQSEVEAKQRKIFMMKSTQTSTTTQAPLKFGDLEVQKKVTTNALKLNIKRKLQGGDWKTRFCVVSPKSSTMAANLAMYRDRNHFDTSPSTPTQIIYLQSAFAQIEPDYVKHEKEYVFRVDARQYIKDKTSQEENRSFLFAGKSVQEITDWVYMIKYTIELASDSNRISVSDSAQPEVIALTDNILRKSDVLLNNELKLSVRILKARKILLPPVYGTNSCYLEMSVDKEVLCSKSTFDGTQIDNSDSSCDEIMNHTITIKQWLRSSLTLSLRTVDLFLSPDNLGSISIPLRDIEIHGGNDADEISDNGRWYPFPRQHSEPSRTALETNNINGEMFLCIQLNLSSELAEVLESHRNFEDFLQTFDATLMEEDRLNQQISSSSNKILPPRIISLNDIKDYIQLSDEISQNYSQGESYEAELRKIIEKKRTKSDVIPIDFSKKLSVKIHQMLRLLNDSSREVEPTTTSGSLNKMWVCRHLREILTEFSNSSQNSIAMSDFEPGDNLKNPYQHVIDQANSLDQQHLDWLASQYTKDALTDKLIQSTSQNTTQNSLSLQTNLSREESIQKKVRRASVIRFENQISVKQLPFAMSSTSSPSTSADPMIFDPTLDINDNYYCKDIFSNSQGPFSAIQLYHWLVTHQIHFQILVSHGRSGRGDYYPLSMLERTLRRIVNSSISEWPIIQKDKSNHLSKEPSGIFADPHHVIHHRYNWDFNVWDLELHELLPLSMVLISDLGLSEAFDINPMHWRNFMDEVQQYMTKHNNPYHNYYHVSDVAQTCFVFLSEMGGFELLRSFEILALLVGAIVHDLDHPGANNLYQVNARTPLSIQYNDISVLENHHCSLAFQVLSSPRCQIFSKIDCLTYKSIRKSMISIILATDMTCHFSLKGDLDDLVKRKFSEGELGLQSDPKPEGVTLVDKEREILLKSILHTADISNPAKSWKISRKWSDLVVEEFFRQGDLEKQEGLPVSPNMDRITTNQDELSINFTDFIVAPFFFALISIFPKLADAVVHLEKNRNEWHNSVVNRLKSTVDSQMDQTILEDTIARWEKRKVVFHDTLTPVLDKALNQLERI